MTTKIEWCDETINPIIGCSKISEGCMNCYAEKMACRLANIALSTGSERLRPYISVTDCYVDGTEYEPGSSWNGKTAFRPSELEKPMKWKKPRRIFIGSMGDTFHESVDFQWVHKIWDMMKACPQHTFLILTKRPERMKEFVELIYAKERLGWAMGFWQHVYLGVTAENQTQADTRIPVLLSIPASVLFVSVEPMLGPVVLTKYIQWCIVGGESGPHARPMHPEWARTLRDQCNESHTPFFFKQWGEWLHGTQDNGSLAGFHGTWAWAGDGKTAKIVARVGKKKSGRLLDGQIWDEFPNNPQ